MNEHDDHTNIVTEKGPTFMQIPLSVSRIKSLSPFAKLLYGRLALFAGKNGVCTPSHETLAEEIGTSDRHVRNLLKELRAAGLVGWQRRRTSSSFTVNAPELFVERNPGSDHERNYSSEQERNSGSDKKRSLKTGSVKDVDYDCPILTNRTARISNAPKRIVQQFLDLKRFMGSYRAGGGTPKKEHLPSDDIVADVMDAAGGRSEKWVIERFRFKFVVKGLAWGVQGGPYSWAWFPAVISEEAEKADAREYRTSGAEIWDHDGTRRPN